MNSRSQQDNIRNRQMERLADQVDRQLQRADVGVDVALHSLGVVITLICIDAYRSYSQDNEPEIAEELFEEWLSSLLISLRMQAPEMSEVMLKWCREQAGDPSPKPTWWRLCGQRRGRKAKKEIEDRSSA